MDASPCCGENLKSSRTLFGLSRLEDDPKSIVDCFGRWKLRGNLGIEHHDIGPLTEPAGILATNSVGKVVLVASIRVRRSRTLAHIACARVVSRAVR